MNFEVLTPYSLDEALEILSARQDVVPLAGGTDVMPRFHAGALRCCTVLNLQEVNELRPQLWSGGHLVLGALTTYRDVRGSSLCRDFPLMRTAAREVGAVAIQSRGTWAGNVANASPAADGVPALMAYDAQIEMRSVGGCRRVPLAGFYTGYKRIARRSDELITAIVLPQPEPGWFSYYRKVGTRRFQAISKVLLAARIRVDGRVVRDLRLVFASVAPWTLRALQTESVIRGRELTPALIDAAEIAIQDEIRPIDDIRSTEGYRRRVTANLLRDFLSAHL